MQESKPMDTQEVRRTQIRRLIDTRYGGKIVLFANAIERAPNYISRQLRGKKGVGEDFCRDVESRLGLPERWLDILDEEAPPLGVPILNAALLAMCFRAVSAYLVQNRQTAEESERVELACYLYEMFHDQESVTEQKMVVWLGRWLAHAERK